MVLIAYADAAHVDPSPAAGAELRATLGDAAFVEAAATVAIFNGLVRAADSSGIPLDDGTASFSVEARRRLGVDDFAGAANTSATVLRTTVPDVTSVDALFSRRFG